MFKTVNLEPGIIQIHVAVWYVPLSLNQNQHSTYSTQNNMCDFGQGVGIYELQVARIN